MHVHIRILHVYIYIHLYSYIWIDVYMQICGIHPPQFRQLADPCFLRRMSSALCGTCGNTSRNLGHSTNLPCPTQLDWVVQVLGRLIFHPKKLVLSVLDWSFSMNRSSTWQSCKKRISHLLTQTNPYHTRCIAYELFNSLYQIQKQISLLVSDCNCTCNLNMCKGIPKLPDTCS